MVSVAHVLTSGRSDTLCRPRDLDVLQTGFYGCLTARSDALFELTDAELCTDGPVRSLVDLT